MEDYVRFGVTRAVRMAIGVGEDRNGGLGDANPPQLGPFGANGPPPVLVPGAAHQSHAWYQLTNQLILASILTLDGTKSRHTHYGNTCIIQFLSPASRSLSRPGQITMSDHRRPDPNRALD